MMNLFLTRGFTVGSVLFITLSVLAFFSLGITNAQSEEGCPYGECGYCGDGIVEGPEECDEGSNNGIACSPNGGSCTRCTSSCEEVIINTTGGKKKTIEWIDLTVNDPLVCESGITGKVDSDDMKNVEVTVTFSGTSTLYVFTPTLETNGSFEIPIAYLDTGSARYVAPGTYHVEIIAKHLPTTTLARENYTRDVAICPTELLETGGDPEPKEEETPKLRPEPLGFEPLALPLELPKTGASL